MLEAAALSAIFACAIWILIAKPLINWEDRRSLRRWRKEQGLPDKNQAVEDEADEY